MPIETIKSLTNTSDEDFSVCWGGIPYSVEAGKTRYFPTYIAKHVAKHFATHQLNKISTTAWRDDASRQKIYDEILGDDVSTTEEKIASGSAGEKEKQEIESHEEEFAELAKIQAGEKAPKKKTATKGKKSK